MILPKKVDPFLFLKLTIWCPNLLVFSMCVSVSNAVEHRTKLVIDVHWYIIALRLSADDHLILWHRTFTQGIPAFSPHKLSHFTIRMEISVWKFYGKFQFGKVSLGFNLNSKTGSAKSTGYYDHQNDIDRWLKVSITAQYNWRQMKQWT